MRLWQSFNNKRNMKILSVIPNGLEKDMTFTII